TLFLTRNYALWIIAALLYPVAHWIPTSTGAPPRIFDILVPIMVIAMGQVSSSMLSAALSKAQN
ncbi:MAG: hypothetical protein KDA75_15840, partial [Planctomycetaceae bacterium]|nr:hypothetical protein [Planctomycetaceae bacterium]